jgi:hypothetical protein
LRCFSRYVRGRTADQAASRSEWCANSLSFNRRFLCHFLKGPVFPLRPTEYDQVQRLAVRQMLPD